MLTGFPAPAFALPGFLLGSVPFGLLLTKAAGLGDIRAIGSGNIGATNVLRTGRKGLAAATLVLDAAKGAAAVLIGLYWGPMAALFAGFGAVLGHMFPPWLGFRGGKGVATGLAVLAAAAWPVGIACCLIWLAMAFAFRRSSAAALAAFAAAPLLGWALLPAGRGGAVAIMALAVAILVFLRHRQNIARLLAGTEPRIGR
ncbi:MAG: glycerol-3-phosphate 1-O-acyltransferase PlsY [Rhodospirillales bacterium]|nr:glycerol-3-phosphate 1-O-acyltransferase PlsY [Rhodospirillales bacterium]